MTRRPGQLSSRVPCKNVIIGVSYVPSNLRQPPMANAFPASLICVAFLSGFLWAHAQENEDAPARRVGIIFEGKFEHADIAEIPAGSKKTQMVASYEWDYGTRSFTEKTWKERGFDWE